MSRKRVRLSTIYTILFHCFKYVVNYIKYGNYYYVLSLEYDGHRICHSILRRIKEIEYNAVFEVRVLEKIAKTAISITTYNFNI